METLKDRILKNGIDLQKIKAVVYKSPHAKEQIQTSKSYIFIQCAKKKKDIWDVIKEEIEGVKKQTGITPNLRELAIGTLYLAWEDIEKNDEQRRLEIYKNSKTE